MAIEECILSSEDMLEPADTYDYVDDDKEVPVRESAETWLHWHLYSRKLRHCVIGN
jgi:hypothetical protein